MVPKNPNSNFILKATYPHCGKLCLIFGPNFFFGGGGGRNKANGGKKEKGVIGSFSHWLCLSPKKNYELNQTGCLEFPLRVKKNNRIAIALGSPSIFLQVTKKGKTCQNAAQ
jgi:hypothetical protein